MSYPCTHCGFENDPTRVYCHNCGEKLERSSEEASTALPGGFTPPQERLRVKRRWHLKETLQLWMSRFYALIKFAVFAALVLMLVQALRAPDDWPKFVEPDLVRAERLTEMLQSAASSPGAVAFKWPAEDVAVWFASVIQFKSSENSYSLRPRGAFALLGDGVLQVGLDTVFPIGSFPVFFKAEYKPVRQLGGYTLEPVGYSIGRLILPSYLGWPVQVQFNGMAEALSAPLSNLAKASEIEITPAAVRARWPGKRP